MMLDRSNGKGLAATEGVLRFQQGKLPSTSIIHIEIVKSDARMTSTSKAEIWAVNSKSVLP